MTTYHSSHRAKENHATTVQRMTHVVFLIAAISAIALLGAGCTKHGPQPPQPIIGAIFSGTVANAAPISASPDRPASGVQPSLADGQGPASLADDQGPASIAAPTTQPHVPTSSITPPITGQPFAPSSSIGGRIISGVSQQGGGPNTYQQGVNTYQGTVNTYGGTNLGQGTTTVIPAYPNYPVTYPTPTGTTSGTTLPNTSPDTSTDNQ